MIKIRHSENGDLETCSMFLLKVANRVCTMVDMSARDPNEKVSSPAAATRVGEITWWNFGMKTCCLNAPEAVFLVVCDPSMNKL